LQLTLNLYYYSVFTVNLISGGILAWRRDDSILKVLLVHPGGPFFVNKDDGAWSIPKGVCEQGEDMLAAACREFAEELGVEINGEFVALAPVKQKGGKVVYGWAVEANVDTIGFRSNTFTIEWPPRSGKKQEFPEVDKAEWFSADEAKKKINAAQVAFIDELVSMVNG
jgi:predicted NUDIX family NTP pyrophosphohydrolase